MMDIIEMSVSGAQSMALFQLKGALNAETFEQLERCAQRWIDRGTRYLVLDLGEVTYLSSAGIRALNHIFHAMRSDAPEDSNRAIRDGMKQGTYRSPHLKLARPQPRVQQVLTLSGVNQFLEIHDDVQTAITSFH
jgi:anti-anti-sigma regulatory factor